MCDETRCSTEPNCIYTTVCCDHPTVFSVAPTFTKVDVSHENYFADCHQENLCHPIHTCHELDSNVCWGCVGRVLHWTLYVHAMTVDAALGLNASGVALDPFKIIISLVCGDKSRSRFPGKSA